MIWNLLSSEYLRSLVGQFRTMPIMTSSEMKRCLCVKKVYPVNYTKKSASLIQIPKEMVTLEVWTQQAFIYALSRSTIGVAPRKTGEWDGKAFSQEVVIIKKDDEKVVLELPGRFAQFYQLENSEISLSAVDDLIFVTVESILPIKESVL
jgi:hypothetical protein